jgi:hypothetical protein
MKTKETIKKLQNSMTKRVEYTSTEYLKQKLQNTHSSQQSMELSPK